jgi:glycosyltransferase involved in cell wall biosynthesis
LTLNGGAAENWPRVGLEAMAAGVPIVAQNAWGWQEMLQHNVSGFLCANDSELVYWLDYLAGTEFRRREIAEAGRARCEELSEPGAIIEGWWRLFRFVQSSERVAV